MITNDNKYTWHKSTVSKIKTSLSKKKKFINDRLNVSERKRWLNMDAWSMALYVGRYLDYWTHKGNLSGKLWNINLKNAEYQIDWYGKKWDGTGKEKIRVLPTIIC